MRHAFRLAGVIVVVAGVAAAPAAAQVDLSGEWGSTFHEDLPHRGGMRLGDYTGLPLNEAGWRKAQSWDEAARSIRERQCIPHVVTYALRGPATIRFSKIVEPVSGQMQGYHLHGSYGRPRTIWMDGRAHPSDLAPHTWGGFSTARWERNTLVVRTTHIKAGFIQRNGAPTSDLATMTEYFTRYDDYLLAVTFVHDPVFLSEPFIRTTNFVFSPTANANAWGACGPAQIADELPGRSRWYVPHYLRHQTEHIEEFLTAARVPAEGARGGSATLYPEYTRRLAELAAAPAVPLRQQVQDVPMGPTPERVLPLQPATGVRVQPVQGHVYMVAGAGANIAVQVGDDGVLLVDTGSGELTGDVLAAVRQLANRPIRYILNTHAHIDHVGGNAALATAGVPAEGGRPADSSGPGAIVIGHEDVLFSMSASSGGRTPLPVAAWPTLAYDGDSKEVFANGEAIQILHQPAAHTSGDSLVFFRRSDVIVTGGILDLTRYPAIDAEAGGTFRGILDGLNRIIELAIPRDWQEGGTMVIPAYGRVADEADVVEYRDMVTVVHDRVHDMIRRGMTLDQVKAARPTFEYDGRYGATSGPWTTEMFVEAAYRDLAGGGEQARRRLP